MKRLARTYSVFLTCFSKLIKELIPIFTNMTITEVQIMPIKASNGLVALASVVFNNSLYLGSIGVYTKRSGLGYRLTYPTKSGFNRNFNIYHPIRKEVSEAIEKAVICKAESILNHQSQRSNDYAGHSNTNNS